MVRVSSSHRKAIFNKELIKKLETNRFKNSLKAKIFAGISITSATLILFTSCSGEQQYSKEDFSKPHPPQAYTLDDDYSVSSEAELNNLIDHDYDNYESYDENNYKIVFTMYNNYDELVNGLNAVLESKAFPDDANTMYRAILDKIYQNYDSWREVMPDLPEKHAYLSELISNISKVNSITFYDRDSKEAQELVEEYGVAGGSTFRSDISFVYKPDVNDIVDLSILLHETEHASVQANITHGDYFDQNYELKPVIVEGCATFHTWFLSPYLNNYAPAYTIEKDNGTQLDYHSHVNYRLRGI